MTNTRETLIWLAGLISTDGCIAKHGNGYQIRAVTTMELDWANKIIKKLEKIEIDASIHIHKPGKESFTNKNFYCVHLKQPANVFKLFQQHKLIEWFIDRKRRLVEKAIYFYTSDKYVKRMEWNKKKINLLKELCKVKPNFSDTEMGKVLDISRIGVANKRYELKIKNKWRR